MTGLEMVQRSCGRKPKAAERTEDLINDLYLTSFDDRYRALTRLSFDVERPWSEDDERRRRHESILSAWPVVDGWPQTRPVPQVTYPTHPAYFWGEYPAVLGQDTVIGEANDRFDRFAAAFGEWAQVTA